MLDRTAWSVALARAAAGQDDPPRQVCLLCVSSLDVSGAGISLITPAGGLGVVCATDDTAAEVEQLQLTHGVGPCMDAVGSGTAVLVPDLGEVQHGQWPGFLPAASAAGVGALFAFPLAVGGTVLGAMDLYRDRPGELRPEELSAARTAADAAAVALLHLDPSTAVEDASAELAEVTHHVQVHQATGMVMAQLGVRAEEAVLRLRARAFAEGRSLPELATDVVARLVRFTEEDS